MDLKWAKAAFLLLAVTLIHLLPRHWTIHVDPMEDVPAVGWIFGVSCLWLNFILMAAFGMSAADARNLTFTKHMFVLPVRTSTLVGWPVLRLTMKLVAQPSTRRAIQPELLRMSIFPGPIGNSNTPFERPYPLGKCR